MTYPVHYFVPRPSHFTRMQLLLRLVAFCAIGMVGLSFGAVFAAAYLLLPALAASRISSEGRAAYLASDGPRVLMAMRWFAAVSAWAGLIAERPPRSSPNEVVTLELEDHAAPTTGSPLLRIITGLPSAFVLSILCWFGTLVWLWAALSVLLNERVGQRPFDYLVGLQRWSIRLLAYQASLVDDYPPFSFDDDRASELPDARVVPHGAG